MTDTIFVRGLVFTGTGDTPIDAAVAVHEGKIVAVGDEAQVRAMATENTEVVELAGGLLMAGFQDSHVHPGSAGALIMSCDLADEHTIEGYLEVIAAYAAGHPTLDWISGGGWSMDAFPGGTPSRQMLDEIVPDRPVYMVNRDHHGGWANTMALRLAGLDRDTPDPVDGRIEREADGTPQGSLHEGAMELVTRLLPTATTEEALQGLIAAQEHLLSVGVTAWQDAMIGAMGGEPDNYEVYLRAVADGSLKARVVGALWWDRERGLEQIPDLVER